MNSTHKRERQSGATMIEVLVAVVVLAIGLLGVAGMQMSALRNNQAAYQITTASILANSIAERMAANTPQVSDLSYNLPVGDPGCGAPVGDSLALKDLADWIQTMQGIGMLGRLSCGGVQCDAKGICDITVRWQDDRSGTDAGEVRNLVVQARP